MIGSTRGTFCHCFEGTALGRRRSERRVFLLVVGRDEDHLCRYERMLESIFRSFFTEHDGSNVREPVIDTCPDACTDQLVNGVADALVIASNRSVGQTISGGRLEDAGR